MSFEETISTRITMGGNDPPETDLDYYARPENYAGASILSMAKIVRAQKKQNVPDAEAEKAANSAALSKLLERYKDVGSNRGDSRASSMSDLMKSSEHIRSKTALHVPSKSAEQSRPSSAGSERSESRGPHQRQSQSADGRKRRKSLSEMMASGSLHDISDTRTGTPKDRLRKQSRRLSDSRHFASDTESEVSRKISSGSRGSGQIRNTRSGSVNTLPAELIREQMAKQRFRHAIKIILILMRWITSLSEKSDNDQTDKQGRTFTDIAQEAFTSDELKNSGLTFDVSQFKAKKEVNISNEVKAILCTPSITRTAEQLQTVLYGLQHLKSFAEYPLHMQEKLCKVAWFQQVPPKRVIIRQGHFAENFYFILAGQAVVRILEKNPNTGETSLRTATIMRKGTSFGELALLHHSRRTATVVSQDTVQLLTIGRDDFFDIFMSGQGPGEIPDHIQFVSGLEFMSDWPCEELLDHPEFCLFHFFKRGVVIVKDSNKSDWLYIVKSGSCQVMKELKSVVPSLGRTRTDLSDDTSLPVRLPKIGTGDAEARVDTGLRRRDSPARQHTPLTAINILVREADLKQTKDGDEIKSFLKVPLSKSPRVAHEEEERVTNKMADKVSAVLLTEPQKVDSYSKSRYRRFPKTRDPHFQTPTAEIGTPRSPSRSSKCKHSHNSQCQDASSSQVSEMTKGPIFVQVEVLKPKDVFGLNTINFDDDIERTTTTVSLVSNGAECVMLSKKFFTDHANELVKKMIRHQIRPYPTDSSLQENLQIKVDWNIYKKQLIRDTIAYRQRLSEYVSS